MLLCKSIANDDVVGVDSRKSGIVADESNWWTEQSFYQIFRDNSNSIFNIHFMFLLENKKNHESGDQFV
jgi:fumarate reductase subunit C